MRWILLAYGVTGLWTFLAYGWDKRAAMRGRPRVRESTLHLLALMGGIVGALAGQSIFRHKTRKRRFLAATWAIATVHAGAWAIWIVLNRS